MKVKVENLERHTVTFTVEEITILRKCCNLLQELNETTPYNDDIDQAFYYMTNVLDSISSNSLYLAEFTVKEKAEEKEIS
jgi:hypothetical protein|nr:MAG TPA: hypothetical protein [Caudoviricetes sp.]